jgi:ribosomal protein S27AE
MAPAITTIDAVDERARMSCPRCGFSEAGPVACPRCGVVFAKLERPPRIERSPGPRFSWFDALLRGAFVAAGVVIVLRWTRPPASPRAASVPGARSGPATPGARSEPSPEPRSRTSPAEAATGRGAGSPAVPVAPPEDATTPPPVSTEVRELALASEDEASYRSLVDAVLARVEIESSHVERAEALLVRHPDGADVGRLAEAVLELAAPPASRHGRPLDAARHRERAAELQPGSVGAAASGCARATAA